MPNRLVVGGVCRFTLEGLWSNGRTVDNIVDMHIFNEGLTTSRTDAINDQGPIIINNWVTDVMPNLCNNYSVTGIRWTDLNTVDGVTGSFELDAPALGGEAAPSTTPNVALLIHKVIGSAHRGIRPGRMYVVGLSEAAVNEDGLIAGDFASSFNDWLGNINQNAGVDAPSYDSRMCVVHGAGGNPVDGVITGSFTSISTLTQDAHCATLRHRLRG